MARRNQNPMNHHNHGKEIMVDPATKGFMKSLTARTLCYLAKDNPRIFRSVTKSSALLCFAVLLEKRTEEVELEIWVAGCEEESDRDFRDDGEEESDTDDEFLEEFIDSDYEMNEGIRDDMEFEKYVDETVEYGEVNQGHENEGADNEQLMDGGFGAGIAEVIAVHTQPENEDDVNVQIPLVVACEEVNVPRNKEKVSKLPIIKRTTNNNSKTKD
nr:uncharacterized protein LOC109157166 [Ipomoea trifida]